MSNAVEQELLRATGFTLTDAHQVRQTYLIDLIKAVSDLSDEDFDIMTDEAKEWSNSAAKAVKAHKPIQDFEEGETSEPSTIEPPTGEEVAVEETKEKPKRPKKSSSDKVLPDGDEKGTRESVLSDDPVGTNRYGIKIGTKRAQVIEMLEHGASMREVKQVHGQAYYNMLKQLEKQGHKIVKTGAFYTLTHKDDVKTEQEG